MYYNRFAIADIVSSHQGIVRLLPNLGYVNRQVYLEIVSYLLSDWRVEMRMEEDIIYFDNILHYMPISMGYHSVKKIAFIHFSQYASTRARALLFIDFLKHLPNIEELLLTMRLDHMHMHDSTPGCCEHAFLMGYTSVKTAEQMATKYSLAMLSELERLSVVMIHCEWSPSIDPRPLTLSAFFDVQEWLAEELVDVEGVKGTIISEPFIDPRCLAAWRICILR
jgi:hypothetical protein